MWIISTSHQHLSFYIYIVYISRIYIICICIYVHICIYVCTHTDMHIHMLVYWELEAFANCFFSLLLQNGFVMCRRMVCDCENPTVDLFCCPECDPRLSSQCLHQNGETLYNSGDTWVQNCQQCRCLVSLTTRSTGRV